MPLGIAGPLGFVAGRVAGGATDPFLIERRGAVFGADRHATAAAKGVRANAQAVRDRYAFVEDEAFAFPAALFGRHFLQIFQDAPFEVVDLVHPLGLEEGGGLFAVRTHSGRTTGVKL